MENYGKPLELEDPDKILEVFLKPNNLLPPKIVATFVPMGNGVNVFYDRFTSVTLDINKKPLYRPLD